MVDAPVSGGQAGAENGKLTIMVGGSEAAFAAAELAESWQPFIWQGKRFPDRSYLTLAFQCSLPATFVRTGNVTLGVVADADELPFSPLPLRPG